MTSTNHFTNLRRTTTPPPGLKDWSWGSALPAAVQLLTNGNADVALPTCPLIRSGEDAHRTSGRALAYWTTLDHLLRYRLGWTFPAQGLSRWIDEGTPDDDTSLALVRRVWLGDGFLYRYLAWRAEHNTDHLSAAWTRRVASVTHEYGREGEPVGPWELHLRDMQGHALAPLEDPQPRLAWLNPFDPTSDLLSDVPGVRPRRLVGAGEPVLLFRGSLESGWYAALDAAPSDRVRVVHESYGLCGHYHRSPTTRRWHTTTEPVHQWGHRSNA